jgi:hypothetical protein
MSGGRYAIATDWARPQVARARRTRQHADAPTTYATCEVET